MTPILNPEQRWVCPNCTQTAVTHETRPHTEFHNCRGLRGLSAPMVPEGTRCKVETRQRDDYIGRDIPQRDGEGQIVMSIVTTRDDGQDCVVLAPTATARLVDL